MEDFEVNENDYYDQVEYEGPTGLEPEQESAAKFGYEFVHKQLEHVGKSAPYRGGFKLREGSQKYRKMSWTIAEYGQRNGVSLLRKAGGIISHLMMPLKP